VLLDQAAENSKFDRVGVHEATLSDGGGYCTTVPERMLT
jgi:hypothetical protein